MVWRGHVPPVPPCLDPPMLGRYMHSLSAFYFSIGSYSVLPFSTGQNSSYPLTQSHQVFFGQCLKVYELILHSNIVYLCSLFTFIIAKLPCFCIFLIPSFTTYMRLFVYYIILYCIKWPSVLWCVIKKLLTWLICHLAACCVPHSGGSREMGVRGTHPLTPSNLWPAEVVGWVVRPDQNFGCSDFYCSRKQN